MYRVRALDPNGDYTFGLGGANFLVNSPAAVGQSILTRLKLMAGEWFLDQTAGTDYDAILGTNTASTRDAAIQATILGATGVSGIVSYSSSLNSQRQFSVTATVETIYSVNGSNTVQITFIFPSN